MTLNQQVDALREDLGFFKQYVKREIRKVRKQMADLDKTVDDVAAAEKAAEVRVKAAEGKAATAQAAAEAAQATSDANAKAAQDAAAALQVEIDSIKAGNAADAAKLADVKTALDGINADPVNPMDTTDTGTELNPPSP